MNSAIMNSSLDIATLVQRNEDPSHLNLPAYTRNKRVAGSISIQFDRERGLTKIEIC